MTPQTAPSRFSGSLTVMNSFKSPDANTTFLPTLQHTARGRKTSEKVMGASLSWHQSEGTQTQSISKTPDVRGCGGSQNLRTPGREECSFALGRTRSPNSDEKTDGGSQ